MNANSDWPLTSMYHNCPPAINDAKECPERARMITGGVADVEKEVLYNQFANLCSKTYSLSCQSHSRKIADKKVCKLVFNGVDRYWTLISTWFLVWPTGNLSSFNRDGLLTNFPITILRPLDFCFSCRSQQALCCITSIICRRLRAFLQSLSCYLQPWKGTATSRHAARVYFPR